MKLNNYVSLGNSGLRVSPLCLGAMTFGTEWGWGSDDATSEKIMSAYIEQGGNFIDTANIYTKGHSEKVIGDYFKSRKGTSTNNPRDRVVLATKFMGNLYLGDPNGGGAGRKAIIAACEQSLRRLQTDYIDLYWAHFWDQNTPLEEMLRCMEDLVKSGKVRYLGLSDHPAWVCAHSQAILKELKGDPVIALQIEYSLAQRTVEAELIPMAKHFGMGVTPWSPLRGGILSGKFNRTNKPTGQTRVKENSPHLTEKNYEIIDTLTAIAKELGDNVTEAQVALRWLNKKQQVSSIILGARTLDQLNNNIACLAIDLTKEHMEKLDTVSEVQHPFPHEFLEVVKTNIQGGTSINGDLRPAWDLAPQNDSERN